MAANDEDVYVFGYGSLVVSGKQPPTREFAPDGYVTDLVGFRRWWGVAMDNSRDLPNYKCYLDEQGCRPGGFVAFLDIQEEAGSRVNGVCHQVSPENLVELDARERNYVRVDVTEMLSQPPPNGRVWVYQGSPEGRARAAHGRETGTAVIHQEYQDTVERGFAALGVNELETYLETTEPGGVPVVSLERVALP